MYVCTYKIPAFCPVLNEVKVKTQVNLLVQYPWAFIALYGIVGRGYLGPLLQTDMAMDIQSHPYKTVGCNYLTMP